MKKPTLHTLYNLVNFICQVKYLCFFKNGKHTHCLDIIPNEDIVASYKIEGVL